MAKKDSIPDNQGGEVPFDKVAQGGRGARGRDGINVDTASIKSLRDEIKGLAKDLKDAANEATALSKGMGGVSGRGGLFGAMGSAVARSMASSLASIPRKEAAAGGAGGGGGLAGLAGGMGGRAGAVSAAVGIATDLTTRGLQYADRRIERGAEYALSADRMTTQLAQMYGMSPTQVRNQLRMPLTQNYLLGGGGAINELLGMQSATGLSAARQASTVEAFRTISGFSYGASDVTKMLSTMASPDVANRMFMFGGGGMYGIGGTQRSGMQVIQNAVRQAGLTNPEALKGALQPGSNTRQRLTAMGIPQDMQDMVIQYAMQNVQFQRKTDGTGMYDPSLEEHRRTMGIEGTLAVQHEKTTGERLKTEEKFYERQVGALATFERNLRTSAKTVQMFDQALSGAYSTIIGLRGHPGVSALKYGASQILGAIVPGGDATVDQWGVGGDPQGFEGKISPENEEKLSQLDARLAYPLRKMLLENPKLNIKDAKRSTEQQERSFKARYTPRPDLSKKTKTSDRIWNGVVWVHDNHNAPKDAPAMAPPGSSWHERGLAADVFGDDAWIMANAARFGLGHGGTGTGGKDDEPFHIQPADTMGKFPPGSEGSRSMDDGGSERTSVSKASAMVIPTSRVSMANMSTATSTATASFTNAGTIASSAAKEGVFKSVNSILAGIDKPYTPQGGDATVGSGQSVSGGGGMSITIAPTIHFNGTQDQMGDLRRLAKEVSSLLEHEVKLTMMRSS